MEVTLDIKEIKKNILQTKRVRKINYGMFGINLGEDLNRRLSKYAKANDVSKSAVVKHILAAFLDNEQKTS